MPSRGDKAKNRFFSIIEDRWELEEALKNCFHDSKKLNHQKLVEKYSKTIVKEMEEKYKANTEGGEQNGAK